MIARSCAGAPRAGGDTAREAESVPANDHLKADLLMVLVTLLAAAGWVFSLKALQGLPPLLFMGVRFLLAGLLLGSIGYGPLRRLDAAQRLRAAGVGVVMGVAMLCWIMGLFHATHVGVGAFITSLGVILAPLAGRLLFAVHVSRSTWAAAAVATAGLACLSLQKGGAVHFTPSDAFFLACAAGLAVHFNLNTRFAARIPVLPLTAVQLGMVGAMALLTSTLVERWPASIGGETLGWLLASILIATSLRFFLQVKAQSMAPVSHAALVMTLEPVWTALVATVWLGERMSGVQLGGCALILCALLISRWHSIVRRPRHG